MGSRIQILRVVVASPSDVASERAIVPAVLEDLNRSICADRGLRLEAVRWETDTYPGFHIEGPQGLIDPILRIEDSEILIGIFWKRFGTATKDASSGTEHEFRIAYEAWKANGQPQVMVYFNQKAYTPRSKEETDQWGRVLEFRRSFPEEGLWCPYKGTGQFEKLLRDHLTNFLRARIPVGRLDSLVASAALPRVGGDQAASGRTGDYFAIQNGIIEEHTRTFAGRMQDRQMLEHFLQTNQRGYFIVVAGPGQGKTAFACQLVRDKGLIHHFVSQTGGRADPRLITRSLLSQIMFLSGAQPALPEPLAELTKVWEEQLAAVSQRVRVVVVVDGLDELPSWQPNETPYLTVDGLPEGAYVVVTLRPGEYLRSLRALVATVPHRIYELSPLGLSEITQIVRSRAPQKTDAEVELIADASQGNPLYVRAALDELTVDPKFDLRGLPSSIEGFFDKATAHFRESQNKTLRDVVGLLAVARKPLKSSELHFLANTNERELNERGIAPIRHFLIESDAGYSFYHTSFHEFVSRRLLYDDELRGHHARIASWLESRDSREIDYRWTSLCHHLFEAGDRERLLQVISPGFLAEKGRRFGYAVLEDIELLSRVILKTRDPASVERCIALVEGLQQVVGDNVIRDATRAIRGETRARGSLWARLMCPRLDRIPGLDVHVSMLPAGEVIADFVEVVPRGDHLFVALGDAPSTGLRSAFAARFIGSLFRDLVEACEEGDLGKLLGTINAAISPYDFFERLSMQCVAVDLAQGLCHIANAGHPDAVMYSARRGKCDVLTLPGDLLHDSFRQTRRQSRYEQYSAEIAPGDILVLLSDGLTEAHRMADPYGYRFTRIVEEKAELGARQVGEAVLQDWSTHRDEGCPDDLTIMVIALP